VTSAAQTVALVKPLGLCAQLLFGLAQVGVFSFERSQRGNEALGQGKKSERTLEPATTARPFRFCLVSFDYARRGWVSG